MFDFLKKLNRTPTTKSENAAPKAKSENIAPKAKSENAAPKAKSEVVDRKALNREKRIRNVMEKTGWTYEQTTAEILAAKAQCGVTFRDYDRCDFHLLSPQEQTEKYASILKKREREKKKMAAREAHIRNIMSATDWTYEETVAKVEAAKANCGISYKDYDNFRFYEVPVEEWTQAYCRINEQKEERKRFGQQLKEQCIEKTVTLTNWSRQEAEARIEDARRRTGCKYKEYIWYRFYELTPEEQEQVCLISLTAKLSEKYNVNKKLVEILNDKELTDRYFSEFIARPWGVNTKMSFEEFSKIFANSKKIIYKPVDGLGGNGIEAFTLQDGNYETVWQALKTRPRGVVEEYVVQHPALSALSPASVNTIRIVTISSKTKPVTPDGKYMDIAYAAIRIGNGTATVDNFHSGGMVAAVDLTTGKIVTDAADMDGRVFAQHPMTGKVFKGYQIPMFDTALQLVTDACAKDGVEGNLGWDIAITENGAVLIEGNIGPGVELLQKPYIAQRKGMKYVMAKYL